MISFLVIFLILALNQQTQAEDQKVSCEKFKKNEHWYLMNSAKTSIGNFNTCYMNNSTVIDSRMTQIVIAQDVAPTVSNLFFSRNKNISFLPTNIAIFPNIKMLTAEDCLLTSIRRENFSGLKNLKVLFLNNNKIKTIYSDTLEDLISLEYLSLSK